MTEQQRAPLTRSEMQQRMLAANVLHGIGNAGCHGAEISSSPVVTELGEGDDFYLISVDTKTGKVSVEPGTVE